MTHQSHIGIPKPFTEETKNGKIIRRQISDKVMIERPWLVLSSFKKGYYCLLCALNFNGRNNDPNVSQKQNKILLSAFL